MNIRLRGDVLIRKEKPAEYMVETDSAGKEIAPAVQVAPAEYAVYRDVAAPEKSSAIVPMALAAVAAWLAFK